MEFPIHTIETAPEAAHDTLAKVNKMYGFTPNLLAVMAESPPSLNAYLQLNELLSETSFDATERQTVLLTVSFENNCEYCMAAHTAIAGQQGVPSDVIDSLRNNTLLANPKLEALRKFTAVVVQSRGLPSEQDLKDFAAVGYTQTQVLEVILGVTIKTLSNYVNHIAQTPVDAAFRPVEWKKAS